MAPTSDHDGPPILDVRRQQQDFSLLSELRKFLNLEDGSEKKLPPTLLYDEKGLQLFEEITYLDEYYLTNAEIEVFEKHAEDIVQHVRPGSQLVELGSGYCPHARRCRSSGIPSLPDPLWDFTY